MTPDYRRAEMPELIADLEAAATEVEREFAPLTAAQLNWKPNPEEWSVVQCLEHTAMTDERYIPQFDALLRGEKRRTPAERLPFLPTLSARVLIRSLDPSAPARLSTTPAFYPTASALDARVVARLLAVQARLIEQMHALQAVDISRQRVTSPFAGFVAYNALDACRIIAAHERVHLNQAQRVAASPGFPR
jgi:hypothetical protein